MGYGLRGGECQDGVMFDSRDETPAPLALLIIFGSMQSVAEFGQSDRCQKLWLI